MVFCVSSLFHEILKLIIIFRSDLFLWRSWPLALFCNTFTIFFNEVKLYLPKGYKAILWLTTKLDLYLTFPFSTLWRFSLYQKICSLVSFTSPLYHTKEIMPRVDRYGIERHKIKYLFERENWRSCNIASLSFWILKNKARLGLNTYTAFDQNKVFQSFQSSNNKFML